MDKEKQMRRLQKEIEDFRNNPAHRSALICAARGCDGCLVCAPEKFSPEAREKFKLQTFRLIDGDA